MLAAHHQLEDLAVQVSAHLLSFHLYNLTDEMVDRMGARYMKRLMFLHIQRVEAFKAILIVPPPAHEGCRVHEGRVQNKWALAVAGMLNDLSPGQFP